MQDEELRKALSNEDSDLMDDFFQHFEDFSDTPVFSWCEVGSEASRAWNLVFGEHLDISPEDFSPVDSFLDAVALGGWKSAMNHVASALGVEVRSLELALSQWCEDQRPTPPPIKPSALMRVVRHYDKWRAYMTRRCPRYNERDPPADCSSPAPVAASRVDVQQLSGHCPSAA